MSAHEVGADEFLSVAQVARRLGCSVSLVQKWRRLGWLPATRLGPPSVPVYGYRASDVERFAAERWNRRRGRPPKQPAPEQTPSITAGPAPQPPETRAPPLPRETAPRPAGPASAATAMPTPARPPSPPVVSASAAPLDVSGATPAPAPPPSPQRSTSRPAGITRPLTLWAGDPREHGALVLARFAPAESETALRLGGLWARRYDHLVLGEAPAPGAPLSSVRIIAEWRHGQRAAPPAAGATGTFGP